MVAKLVEYAYCIIKVLYSVGFVIGMYLKENLIDIDICIG